MKKHTFKRESEDNLIVVPCMIDADPLALALDTGASHTTIDLNPLLMAGYELKDAIRTEQIETASGVLDTYVFVVEELSGLGVVKKKTEIRSYDFFAYHLLTDFDGVLGLDFFDDRELCINFRKLEITVK